jgi:hypothetical protein
VPAIKECSVRLHLMKKLSVLLLREECNGFFVSVGLRLL